MQIHRLFNENSYRNFTYILFCREQGEAWCIDPFEADSVIEFLSNENLKLTTIINTHQHWDHIRGNEGLIKRYQIKVWDENNLSESQCLELGAGQLIVHFTPGHTNKHFCLLYLNDGKKIGLFCGDTLFNSGAGNCKNGGDPYQLFKSYKSFIYQLPDHLEIYPGHDYLENNLKFTLSIQPDNQYALAALERFQQNGYEVKTLGEERMYNLFLLSELRDSENAESEFVRLRELRDKW